MMNKKVCCKFRKQVFNARISQFKQHLARQKGNCVQRSHVPDDVKKVIKILDNFQAKKSQGGRCTSFNECTHNVHVGEEMKKMM